MFPNKYQTWCRACRRDVGPGEGWLESKDPSTGRWKCVCDACWTAEAEAEAWARARRTPPPPPPELGPETDPAFQKFLHDPKVLGELYAVWKAQPPTRSRPRCLEVLDLWPPVDAETIHRQFRQQLITKRVHPDHGGSAAAFLELQRARDEALALVAS